MPHVAMPAVHNAVFAAQATFRKVMDATARPGSIQRVAAGGGGPAPLASAAAAVALTLFDHDTPVWLDAALATDVVIQWLRFNTGCPIVDDPAQAAFAVAWDLAALPPLARFAPGTPDYPDRSTTLILQLAGLTGGNALTLSGPGIRGATSLEPVGLPEDFVTQLAGNRALFPRGVDVLLVAGHEVAALPRTTIVTRT